MCEWEKRYDSKRERMSQWEREIKRLRKRERRDREKKKKLKIKERKKMYNIKMCH